MKNKKIILPLIIVIVVTIIVILGIFVYFESKDKISKDTKVTLNLEEINQNISNLGQFNKMKTIDLDKEILSSVFEIDANMVEKVVGQIPLVGIKSSMYLLIEPKERTKGIYREKSS